jgi:hypothetical protein
MIFKPAVKGFIENILYSSGIKKLPKIPKKSFIAGMYYMLVYAYKQTSEHIMLEVCNTSDNNCWEKTKSLMCCKKKSGRVITTYVNDDGSDLPSELLDGVSHLYLLQADDFYTHKYRTRYQEQKENIEKTPQTRSVIRKIKHDVIDYSEKGQQVRAAKKALESETKKMRFSRRHKSKNRRSKNRRSKNRRSKQDVLDYSEKARESETKKMRFSRRHRRPRSIKLKSRKRFE